MDEATRLEAGIKLQHDYATSHLDSQLLVCQQLEYYGRKTNSRIWQGHAWRGYGVNYLLSGQPDSAILAYRRALALSEGQKDALHASVLSSIGTFHKLTGQTDSCLYYYSRAMPLAKQYKDSTTVRNLYLNQGTTLMDMGKYADVIRLYEEGKKYADDAYHVVVAVNMGAIFFDVKMMKEAKEQGLKALKFATRTNDFPGQIDACRILAATEEQDFNAFEAFVSKGIQLGEQFALNRELCDLYRVAGVTAHQTFGKLDRGVYYLEKAVELGAEYGDFGIYTASIHDLANIRLAQKNPQEALRLCRIIQSNIQQEDQFDAVALFDFYNVISKTFDQLGQVDSAYYYLKKMDAAKVRSQDFDNYNGMLASYLKYQYAAENEALQREKAAAEAITKETRRREQANYRLFGVLGLLLVGIAAAFFFFSRQKQRAADRLALANTALLTEQDKLRRTNAQLQRFSSVVSHDLLSSLNLILSAGKVLVGSQPRKENLLQYHEMAHRVARRMKDYCQNLLDEARREVAISPAAPQPTDPMPILQNVLASFEHPLREARFDVQVSPFFPSLLPAPIQEQVFQNLIANAIHHGATSSQPILRIGEEENPQGIPQWVVEDNGPGVPPEVRETIFQFGNAEGNRVGQKMGLSLLRDSLRGYDFDIRAEERVGGGARFVIAPL